MIVEFCNAKQAEILECNTDAAHADSGLPACGERRLVIKKMREEKCGCCLVLIILLISEFGYGGIKRSCAQFVQWQHCQFFRYDFDPPRANITHVLHAIDKTLDVVLTFSTEPSIGWIMIGASRKSAIVKFDTRQILQGNAVYLLVRHPKISYLIDVDD